MGDIIIEDLLEKIKIINNKYDEIAESTGERFNIFTILNVERNEVSTHSMFLRELLSPKGSHGQKAAFLNLFVHYLNVNFPISTIPDFPDYSAVEVEKYTGIINNEYTVGGRMDIVIEGNRRAIIIENKIDAGDQYNQLLRYYNYAKKNYDSFELIYLTKEGRKPDSLAAGNQNEVFDKVVSLSYEKHIIEWLKLCREEAADLPVLHETIVQYINLLKKLTNQTVNNKMSSELKDVILKTPDTYLAALSIYNEFQQVKEKIKNCFWIEVSKKVCEQLGSEWEYNIIKPWGIVFSKRTCSIIGFAIDGLASGHIAFGIFKHQSSSRDKKNFYNKPLNNLAERYGYKVLDDWWIVREKIQFLDIYDKEILQNLLPLREDLGRLGIVKSIVGKIISCTKNGKHFKYMDAACRLEKENYSILLLLKSLLENRTSCFSIGIWEGFILHLDWKIQHNLALAFDVIFSEGNCSIEIFFRGEMGKISADDLFEKLNLFSLAGKSNDERTSRNGLIYKIDSAVAAQVAELLIGKTAEILSLSESININNLNKDAENCIE